MVAAGCNLVKILYHQISSLGHVKFCFECFTSAILQGHVLQCKLHNVLWKVITFRHIIHGELSLDFYFHYPLYNPQKVLTFREFYYGKCSLSMVAL